MGWLYVDDGFPEHPKALAAGGDACWLWICGFAYTHRAKTEGVIPKAVVQRLSDRKNASQLAKRLVEVGLWEDRDGAFYMHEYDQWNSREIARRAAGKRGAESRWRDGKTTDLPDGKSGELPDGKRKESQYLPPSPSPTTKDSIKSEASDPPGFGEFWMAYPRKVGRRAARAKWIAQSQAGESPDALIEASKNYALAMKARGTEKQFMLHPSTFLGPDERFREYLTLERESVNVVNPPVIHHVSKWG